MVMVNTATASRSLPSTVSQQPPRVPSGTVIDHEALLARASHPISTLPRPFLKWAGSKRSLLTQIVPYLPGSYLTYHEPFLGGGSMFFLLEPVSASISDLCAPLIATYQAVGNGPREVRSALVRLKVDKESYYRIRSSRPRKPHTRAARFVYLNKTCWNGLYRENLKGDFNVPFGRPKSRNTCTLELLAACGLLIARPGVTVRHADFETVLDQASPGDLVFLDPPYATTAPRRSTFLEYNGTIFSWNDQVRLAAMANALADRGCSVLVTNASAPEIAALYSAFDSVDLLRSSTISTKVKERGLASEVLFYSHALAFETGPST